VWSLPYLLAVAFLFAPTLLVLLFAASKLEGRLLAKQERSGAVEQADGTGAGPGDHDRGRTPTSARPTAGASRHARHNRYPPVAGCAHRHIPTWVRPGQIGATRARRFAGVGP
jgi:hypothetical protein